jgi:hypothetical protein
MASGKKDLSNFSNFCSCGCPHSETNDLVVVELPILQGRKNGLFDRNRHFTQGFGVVERVNACKLDEDEWRVWANSGYSVGVESALCVLKENRQTWM